MPATYTSLHFHLVFSTRDRVPWIAPEWQARLHGYLGGTIAGLSGTPLEIGGVADHVHLLIGLRASHRPCDVLQELKKASSVWVHEEIGEKAFAWQAGYAAFTVSPTARGSVRKYIANQVEHHRQTSYRDELVRLLTKAGVDFDAKYLEQRPVRPRRGREDGGVWRLVWTRGRAGATLEFQGCRSEALLNPWLPSLTSSRSRSTACPFKPRTNAAPHFASRRDARR